MGLLPQNPKRSSKKLWPTGAPTRIDRGGAGDGGPRRRSYGTAGVASARAVTVGDRARQHGPVELPRPDADRLARREALDESVRASRAPRRTAGRRARWLIAAVAVSGRGTSPG